MSKDWVKDMNEMHRKFGVHEWVSNEKKSDWNRLAKFMQFRIAMMQEELDETKQAVSDQNQEEIVDGIIDLCVFAIGTLDVFGIDAHKAWDEVYRANMSKEVGVKESRPNPLGLPDLIKPEGWKGPSHEGNNGNLADAV